MPEVDVVLSEIDIMSSRIAQFCLVFHVLAAPIALLVIGLTSFLRKGKKWLPLVRLDKESYRSLPCGRTLGTLGQSSIRSNTMVRAQAAFFLVLVSPNVSCGQIIFSAVGNDLLVTFSAPIVFDVNVKTFVVDPGISIESAYTSNQPNNVIVPHIGDASLTVNAAPTTTIGESSGTRNPASNATGPTDLFMFWDLPGQNYEVGDKVTVSAGTRTLPNFIGAGGIVPNSIPSSLDVILIEGIGANQISLPVSVAAVPEPSACLFLGLVGITLGWWQWKRKAA